MTNGLVLLAHWSVRQIPNRVSLVTSLCTRRKRALSIIGDLPVLLTRDRKTLHNRGDESAPRSVTYATDPQTQTAQTHTERDTHTQTQTHSLADTLAVTLQCIEGVAINQINIFSLQRYAFRTLCCLSRDQIR